MSKKNKQTEGNTDQAAIYTVLTNKMVAPAGPPKTSCFNFRTSEQIINHYRNSKCILEPRTGKKKTQLNA